PQAKNAMIGSTMPAVRPIQKRPKSDPMPSPIAPRVKRMRANAKGHWPRGVVEAGKRADLIRNRIKAATKLDMACCRRVMIHPLSDGVIACVGSLLARRNYILPQSNTTSELYHRTSPATECLLK